jgi:hypothetical protein
MGNMGDFFIAVEISAVFSKVFEGGSLLNNSINGPLTDARSMGG